MVTFATSKLITKIHKFAASFDDPRRAEGMEAAVDQFIAGNTLSAKCFGGKIRMLHHQMVANLDAPITANQFDWVAWRLAHEYTVLGMRTSGQQAIQTWPEISERLRVAYEYIFLGREEQTKNVLEAIKPEISKIADRVVTTKGNPLAAVGLFFSDVTGSPPDHPSFALPSEGFTLENALENRTLYSDDTKEGGALLPGPFGTLVPLEVMYLNAKLPSADRHKLLADMANAMHATDYPADEQFIDLDVKLSVAGL